MFARVVYVFCFSEHDIGPRKHASAVVTHTNSTLSYISNTQLDVDAPQLSRIALPDKMPTICMLLLFQLKAVLVMLKHRREFDCVLVRQSVGFFVIQLVGKLMGKVVVTEVNGVIAQDLRDRGKDRLVRTAKHIERLSYSLSDRIICVHENIRKHLMTSFGASIAARCVVIENGIDLAPVSSASEPPTEDQLTIGYLGSFAHREGVDLLPLVSQQLDKLEIPHRFVVVGGTDPQVTALRKQAEARYVSTNFALYGTLPYEEAMETLRQCHFFIHLRRPIDGATNSQGAPLKILDYLNLNRRIVATDLDSYQFLRDHGLGVLVPYSENSFAFRAADTLRALWSARAFETYQTRGTEYLKDKTWDARIGELDEVIDAACNC